MSCRIASWAACGEPVSTGDTARCSIPCAVRMIALAAPACARSDEHAMSEGNSGVAIGVARPAMQRPTA